MQPRFNDRSDVSAFPAAPGNSLPLPADATPVRPAAADVNLDDGTRAARQGEIAETTKNALSRRQILRYDAALSHEVAAGNAVQGAQDGPAPSEQPMQRKPKFVQQQTAGGLSARPAHRASAGESTPVAGETPRARRLREIRLEIANGTYDTPERLEIALDRMLADICR